MSYKCKQRNKIYDNSITTLFIVFFGVFCGFFIKPTFILYKLRAKNDQSLPFTMSCLEHEYNVSLN